MGAGHTGAASLSAAFFCLPGLKKASRRWRLLCFFPLASRAVPAWRSATGAVVLRFRSGMAWCGTHCHGGRDVQGRPRAHAGGRYRKEKRVVGARPSLAVNNLGTRAGLFRMASHQTGHTTLTPASVPQDGCSLSHIRGPAYRSSPRRMTLAYRSFTARMREARQ